MRRSRRGSKKSRFTIGWLLAAAVIAVAALGAYLYSFNFNPTAAGFPFPCGGEKTTMHVHPLLKITIDGQGVAVPAGIGIISGGTCFEPMHTHDALGIVHLEAPDTNTQYTLGQFFQIWSATYHTVTINGVSQPIVFNSTDILGFKADATHAVTLLVDGKPSSEYGSLVLNTLDYCPVIAANSPCGQGFGEPYYGGQPYTYGDGHTVVIEYTKSG